MAQTIDDLVLQIRINDAARAERQTLKRDLKDLEKQLAAVRMEQGKDSTQAKELEQKIRSLNTQIDRSTKIVEQSALASRRRRAALAAEAKATDEAHRSTTRLGTLLKSPVFAGASLVGGIYVLQRLLSTYAEAAAQQSQLTLAMEKFPAAARLSRDSYDQLNASLLRTTGADDDLLAQSEATLARFHLEARQIQELIPLVNDLADAKQMDLVSASEAVGKALMGNAKILKSVGIDFKATGNTSLDYLLLLQALQTQVGGTGKAFGDSAAGGMEIFKQQWSNLKEGVGEGLAPALDPMNEALGTFLGFMESAPPWLRLTASGVILVGFAMVSLTPTIMQGVTAWNSYRTAQAAAGAGAVTMRARIASMVVGMGPWGLAIGGGIALLAGFAAAQSDANDRAQALKATLDQQTGAATSKTLEDRYKIAQDSGIFDVAERIGMSQHDVMQAIMGTQKDLDAFMRAAQQKSKGILGADPSLIAGVNGLSYEIRKQQDAISADNAEMIAQQQALEGLSAGYDTAAGSAARLTAQSDALKSGLSNLDSWLSRRSLRRNIEQQLKDAAKSKTRASYDEALGSISQLASTYKDPEKAAAVLKAYEAKFFAALQKSGAPKKVISEYKGALDGPLTDATTKEGLFRQDVKMTTEATEAATRAQLLLNQARTATPTSMWRQLGSTVPGQAGGGWVHGPGTGTSDSVLRRLSNREFVVRQMAATSLGDPIMQGLNNWDRLSQTQRAPIVRKLAATIPPAPDLSHIRIPARAGAAPVDRRIMVTSPIHVAKGVDWRAEMDSWKRMQDAENELQP